MKRALALALSICLLTGLLVFPASAETETSGTCGDNLTWTLDTERDILTISGTGPMYDYTWENPAPWVTWTTGLKRIEISEGVTSIGDYAFCMHGNVASNAVRVIIPASVESIGQYAFRQTNFEFNLWLFGNAPTIENTSLYSVQDVCGIGWSDEEIELWKKQKTFFKDAYLTMNPNENIQLRALNEPIVPEELIIRMQHPWDYVYYLPREISVGPYDNSTYGEKNVTITVDGIELVYTYYVTDGTNHLDLIQVTFPELPESVDYYAEIKPIVTMGSVKLTEKDHYDLTSKSNNRIKEVTVTGKGIAEGFEQTFYYPILLQDLANCRYVSYSPKDFTGTAHTLPINVQGMSIHKDRYYTQIFENNINMGDAVIRAIGLEECYGELRDYVHIGGGIEYIYLSGECIGTIDGEISTDIPIYEEKVQPGMISTRLNSGGGYHIAVYELYRVDEDQLTPILEYITDVGNIDDTAFEYDFSYVYEEAMDKGGEVFLLAYSWIKETGEVYAGAIYLTIPSKVPDATSMTLQYVENDNDFRKEYLSMVGDNGALGEIIWTTSDPSIATVEKGIVTLKKPGKVTITGQYNDMIESIELTATALDLTEGYIFDYSEQTDTARVIYGNRQLEAGTDYILSVSYDENGERLITATGCGLFQGQLVKEFDGGPDDLANPHTHSFDSICDGTCNSCEYTRSNDHSFSDKWTKSRTHHWHACTACGAKTDEAEHVLSPEDSEVCTVCGTLYIPGDIDCNMLVNRDDVVQLLLHVSMPDAFPIEVDADFTGDGTVNRDDVVQLLLHVSMPDAFPL